MKPLDLSRAQAPVALAALRALAQCDGPPDDAQHALLAEHARAIGHEGVLDALPAHDPAALARWLPAPRQREALVEQLVIMAMIDGAVHPAEVALARRTALALGVKQPAIGQLELFVRGRFRCLAFDLLRRGFIAEQLRRVYRRAGWRGVWRVAKQLRGRPDAALAARYLALEALPCGTLGRELFEHFRANDLPLPGEAKSAPEALLFHDLGHVLSGYRTDPEGEVQISGFEAGYMGDDGFSVALLALYLFHLGADINPTTAPTRGRFALVPFRAAFARGAALAVDLRDWDPWPHVARPLDEVRVALLCAPG